LQETERKSKGQGGVEQQGAVQLIPAEQRLYSDHSSYFNQRLIHTARESQADGCRYNPLNDLCLLSPFLLRQPCRGQQRRVSKMLRLPGIKSIVSYATDAIEIVAAAYLAYLAIAFLVYHVQTFILSRKGKAPLHLELCQCKQVLRWKEDAVALVQEAYTKACLCLHIRHVFP
jgi:hypothetical protein